MAAPKEVVLTGVQIPFFSMVWLILKWALASIPAMVLLWMLSVMLLAVGGGAAAAILAAIGMASEQGAG